MYYIGVDLGGTNIAVGLVDENYKIVAKDKLPTLREREPEAIVADIATLCKNVTKAAGASFDDVAYVGIAAPGTVDPDKVEVKYANNLKMFHFPMGKLLSGMIPVKKVYLENDANAAALGEAVAGAGRGHHDVIMITLGTGLGGGIVIDGKLYSGFNYAGAEIGHMAIELNGRPCTCGRRGCWEAYCSATALIEITKERLAETKDTIMWDMINGDIEKTSGRTAFNAMRQGDALGTEIVNEYISNLAFGMTNIVNIFQPEVFCIGGGISNEGQPLADAVSELVDRWQYGTHSHDDKTVIKIAELGNDAGIIGAAVLGL